MKYLKEIISAYLYDTEYENLIRLKRGDYDNLPGSREVYGFKSDIEDLLKMEEKEIKVIVLDSSPMGVSTRPKELSPKDPKFFTKLFEKIYFDLFYGHEDFKPEILQFVDAETGKFV